MVDIVTYREAVLDGMEVRLPPTPEKDTLEKSRKLQKKSSQEHEFLKGTLFPGSTLACGLNEAEAPPSHGTRSDQPKPFSDEIQSGGGCSRVKV